jgi:hypothetical protein
VGAGMPAYVYVCCSEHVRCLKVITPRLHRGGLRLVLLTKREMTAPAVCIITRYSNKHQLQRGVPGWYASNNEAELLAASIILS